MRKHFKTVNDIQNLRVFWSSYWYFTQIPLSRLLHLSPAALSVRLMAYSCLLFKKMSLPNGATLAKDITCPLTPALPWQSITTDWWTQWFKRSAFSFNIVPNLWCNSRSRAPCGTRLQLASNFTSVLSFFPCLILLPTPPFSWELSLYKSHALKSFSQALLLGNPA